MRLVFYDERFAEQIENYTITDEQMRYTISPVQCISLQREDSDRHSILAFDQEKLVTFFVLHENEGVKPYSINDKAILLRAFSTDFHEQGKGYAKRLLRELPAFVKQYFPHIDEIVLAVNIQNTIARGLYEKCGFQDNGERRMGIKGELVIMGYSFKA